MGTQLAVRLEHTYEIIASSGFLRAAQSKLAAASIGNPNTCRVIAPAVPEQAIGSTGGAQQRDTRSGVGLADLTFTLL